MQQQFIRFDFSLTRFQEWIALDHHRFQVDQFLQFAQTSAIDDMIMRQIDNFHIGELPDVVQLDNGIVR